MDSVRKGRRFEKDVAKRLRDSGVEARRIVSGPGQPGDLVQGRWLIECKSVKSPRYRAALEQCEETLSHGDFRSRGIDKAAAVVKRTGDLRGPIVVLRLDDWIELHRRLERLEREKIVTDILGPAQAGGGR